MKLFPYAHATHPQWRMAAALVLAQLRAQMALPDHAAAPALALLYITDHYANEAEAILAHLSAELPEVTDWSGTVGVGVAANNVEYFDEPAMAVMLCDLTPNQYRVFSGVAPLLASGRTSGSDGFVAHTALVHADGNTPELAELIAEVAERTSSGYVFGGLAASRNSSAQFAFSSTGTLRGQGAASGVFHGGLSGVAFGPTVDIVSRVTQGAQPVARERTVTEADRNLVLTLDGEPALDVLLRELQISLDQPEQAMPRLRATLVGLTPPASGAPTEGVATPRRGQFGPEVTVRHLIGLDPGRRGVAIADLVPVGTRLAFCERNMQAARADLTRVCAEVREELEPEELSLSLATALASSEPDAAPHPARRMAGAVYVSCSGRGGPHFGGQSAELQIVRRALGDVPLVGFFAGGEIAHHRLYGYTGVLTVFTMPMPA
ncbi:MAG: FIST C-terminal domain-containing protein [Hydrogenophaga sp.]|uniref:FIST signal transduction protein n=1 Tax=Hydrogenophaga sp. TaxID=1904254 RepID=UPI0027681FF9|nr:FIST N-terminal domain-containing protein [Hydrogenophaga sp.]MDP2416692.1 FIST C-terminal domain-containing protein [Hydrogenophaga sp.]MDZ4189474.1 FIST C-terminal domain-containing protein [Hydrogenophaga sp.]